MIVALGVFTAVKCADDEKIEYSQTNGFIYYYPLPADDADTCDVTQVAWNKPFVRVWLLDVGGVINDAVQIGEHKANSLYDIEEIGAKVARMKVNDPTINERTLEGKKYKLDAKDSADNVKFDAASFIPLFRKTV